MEIAGKVIVLSGDMSGAYETLPRIAAGADLFVAHNVIPGEATGVARNLHMPPSVIGTIAEKAKVRQLVLSHRMLRTLGREEHTLRYIQEDFNGPVKFAEDLDCFRP